jgi:type II secretory pathway pseudopilin PulG
VDRLTRQDGHTLAELLVVVATLGLVAGGLLSVYELGQRAYARTISLEEAQQGGRAGLERLADELRLIGAYYSPGITGGGPAITAATASGITFTGDVDGDSVGGSETTTTAAAAAGVSSVPVSASAGFSPNEFVYIANGATREVRQITAVAGNTLTLATGLANSYPAGSVARSVETVTYALAGSDLTRSVGGGPADVAVGRVTSFTLTYLDGAGATTAVLANIRQIQISLTVQGPDGSRRTNTTSVKIRSLE